MISSLLDQNGTSARMSYRPRPLAARSVVIPLTQRGFPLEHNRGTKKAALRARIV
jgi:hypothetical protein